MTSICFFPTSGKTSLDDGSVLSHVLDEDGVHGYHGVEQAGGHSSLPFHRAILDGKKEMKKSRDTTATKTTTRVTDGYHMIQHSRPTHTLDAMPVVKRKEIQISIEKRRTDAPFHAYHWLQYNQLKVATESLAMSQAQTTQ
jgi:hypothetical protein